MSKKHKDYRFPFSVVKSAIEGDSVALHKIWCDYEPYVNTLCGRPYQDAYGNVHYAVDQDMKDYMREQLIWAIMNNFDMNYGQNEE